MKGEIILTREVFENARTAAVKDYLAKAQKDFIAADNNKQRNKSANARRRIDQSEKLLAEWDKNGFWTIQNEQAYITIYIRNECSVSDVSAF